MFNVTVVTEASEIPALTDEWIQLIEETPGISFFLSPGWVKIWWKHYGQDASPFIIIVRDTDNKLRGIAPLMCLRAGRKPFAINRLVFIGTGIAYPAHLDIIARQEDKSSVIEACLRTLENLRTDWDVLELISLSPDSSLHTYLKNQSGKYKSGYGMPCPYISLPDDWRSYELESLSANMRQQLRRSLRRIEKDYPDQVSYETITDPANVEIAIKTLIHLNRHRWHDQDTRSSFDDSTLIDFSLDLAALALERGWLRLSVLRVGDTIIAASYCLRFGSTYYNYQNAFHLDWHNYSPGRLMMRYVIQQAIEEGASEFDFLHGMAGAKQRWSPEIRLDRRTRYSSSIKGDMLLTCTALFDDLVQFSRKHIPESIRERASRLLPQTQW